MKGLEALKKLLKTTPQESTKIDKNFKLELSCEECGFQTNSLNETHEGLYYCNDCAEAHERRTGLRLAEEEFNRGVDQNEIE